MVKQNKKTALKKITARGASKKTTKPAKTQKAAPKSKVKTKPKKVAPKAGKPSAMPAASLPSEERMAEQMAATVRRMQAADAAPAPLTAIGAVITATAPCVCSDAPEEHGHDSEHPGSTACSIEDCECIAYEADPQEEKPTYEDEHPATPVNAEDDPAGDYESTDIED